MKEFGDGERERIKELLLRNGRALFAAHGIKKTSISELARAAGIAKGSFYAFFDSKEDLYFQILVSEISSSAGNAPSQYSPDKTPKQFISELLGQALQSMETNPMLRLMMDRAEYECVYRKLSASGKHSAEIANPLTIFFQGMQRRAMAASGDPAVFTGMVKCLFLLCTHKIEIGEDVYDSVMSQFTDMVAERLAGGSTLFPGGGME